jgi:Flp pilus assembly protein TadG
MRAWRHQRDRGQALVEFSLSIIIFLVLMMAIVDLGRGIYMFNGVSEAAREIARVASVHPGTTFGGPEITAVVNTQKKLIPNLGNPTFACVDIDGGPGLDPQYGTCPTGAQVTVTISAPYGPVTPLMGLVGTWNMQSTSSVRIP